MTVPTDYARAVDVFNAFLKDAADEADMTTRHQSYTMVEGVLHAFRRRLSPADAIAFAQVLPPLVRALFVDRWDPSQARAAFGSRAEMTAEVQALRRHHNLSPEGSIANVAAALRRHVDAAAFDAALARLSPEAQRFWAIPPG